MTLDTQFIQNNLPDNQDQIELLKLCLEAGNKGRANIYKFNFVSDVDRTKRQVLKIGAETKLKVDFYRKEEYPSSYLATKVKTIFMQLALGIFIQSLGRHLQYIKVLEPEALLEKTYISFVEREEEIYLVGIIGIYFEN